MNTKEQFEEIDRKMLADLIKRRDLLNSGIAQLEYRLANPPEPINQDRVDAWVSEQMRWSAEYQEGFYQRLLAKEQSGTLSEGESLMLEHFRERMKGSLIVAQARR